MTATAPTTVRASSAPATGSASATTLLCGLAVAGPLFMGSSLLQAALRPGFDIRKHAASLLTNGDLGWIQLATFLIAGIATVAGAAGLRRSMTGTTGGRWAPRLIAVYGLSLIGAGLFAADPAQGFPIGTPEGPGAVSGHGMAHIMIGSVGFLALIIACGVFTRHHLRTGRRAWAAWSAVTGVLFTAAFAGIASGPGSTSPAITLSFWIAVALAWTWLTATALARIRGRH